MTATSGETPSRRKSSAAGAGRILAGGTDLLVQMRNGVVTPGTIVDIKKIAELEWKPMHLMTDVSISIGAVMKPAGLEASEGVLSAGYLKDASDPQWASDEGMKKFMAFVDKYMPGANIADTNLVYGYAAAQTMVQVLKQAGDELNAVEADALSLPVGIGALPDLVFVDPPYDAIGEVAPPLFAKWSEILPPDWGGLIVFEMPGEQVLEPPGWTCRKRLGRGTRQPSVAFFARS